MIDINPERLLPQRGRMKLVDAVVAVGDGTAATVSTVTEKWPLAACGGVDPLVLVELVAQTAAVAIGWPKLKTGRRMGSGGLLQGVKRAAFHTASIPVNSRITTRAAVGFSMDPYTEITGVSVLEGREIGEVTLQVVRIEAEAA